MSANITPNLYSCLTGDAGLEKRAMRMLANLRAFNNPGMMRVLTPKHTEEMLTIANSAPKAANGAWSPTNMINYIVENKLRLPAYHAKHNGEGALDSLAGDFASRVHQKAVRASEKAKDQYKAYLTSITDGKLATMPFIRRMGTDGLRLAVLRGMIPVDPKSLKRLDQLSRRVQNLNPSIDAGHQGMLSAVLSH